jgi:hypothetical protein
LNCKSAALNQLSYAGVPHTKAVFSELIKCSSRPISRAAVHAVSQEREIRRVEVLEIIADNLKKRGWSLGWISAVDSQDEQSGLLAHTATENVSLCTPMKS